VLRQSVIGPHSQKRKGEPASPSVPPAPTIEQSGENCEAGLALTFVALCPDLRSSLAVCPVMQGNGQSDPGPQSDDVGFWLGGSCWARGYVASLGRRRWPERAGRD
jgi:hypothetical protein